MTEQERKKKKRAKRKKKMASMLAMILVLSVGMWGTMAYLKTLSNKEVNTFTGSEGITLKLTEPAWWEKDDQGNITEHDSKKAKNYSPGMKLNKNPQLTNNTTGDTKATEWVAMVVTYKIGNDASPVVYKPISYGNMKNLIKELDFVSGQDGNGGVWKPVYVSVAEDNGTYKISSPTLTSGDHDKYAFAIYLYDKTLANNTSTGPLFEHVELKDTTALEASSGGLADLTAAVGGAGTSDLSEAYSTNGNLPGFQIDVFGVGIKNEYVDGGGNLIDTYDQLINDGTTNQPQDLLDNMIEVIQSNIDQAVLEVGATTP